MEELLADHQQCQTLLSKYGSPLNVMDFSAVARNIDELVNAATDRGVELRVFVARKANKALGLVDAAHAAGHGVDVASLRELEQCLERGVPGEDLIVTAAVKSRALLQVALGSGSVVSVDNADELDDVLAVAESLPTDQLPARLAVRMAASHPDIAPSRFGLSCSRWISVLARLSPQERGLLSVDGIHFHLNGYSARERALALAEAGHFADELRGQGHPVSFVDMGGGVPMNYLRSEEQWREFWRALAADSAGVLTWKGDRLGLQDPEAARPSAALYPFWQEQIRGPWLGAVLDARTAEGESIASMLTRRRLHLRCEPGRAVLDGCGLTLAHVAFTKRDREGTGLVGLHMNRTQMRSTSVDVLLDPRWVEDPAAERTEALDGFLVGAYCIEDEAILRRRLAFPGGVARSDIAAFVNTAGYLMHIIESASHQLPLALNLVKSGGGWALDDIDSEGSRPQELAR
ncbi:Y4yA family PLP-dependent enzyme [Galactobacter caseinivorans]|uniref:Y4yA family PLP-dependent enzyme n=2 Tax=Galactobacter caseinivorans TaxID=2676123 RepID=A0A496PFK1_9MICC|nr:Y4yA family PLP-dependent enzyme [Galactobacter caseinivorans]